MRNNAHVSLMLINVYAKQDQVDGIDDIKAQKQLSDPKLIKLL